MKLFTKEFIKGYFSRNKKLILISLVILLVFVIIGAIAGNIFAGEKYGMFSKMMSETNKSISYSDIAGDAVGLFTHNLFVDLMVFIGGILFSIISLILVIFNAVAIGAPFGGDLYFSMVSIFPHFIFEYMGGSVFALTGAFLITKLEISAIKKRSVKEAFLDSYVLKDIIFTLILMVILLLVAAIIEAYATPMITLIAFGK